MKSLASVGPADAALSEAYGDPWAYTEMAKTQRAEYLVSVRETRRTMTGSANGWARKKAAHDADILQRILYTTLHEVVGRLDAVMGIIYLAEKDGNGLGTAMVAGFAPSIFWMPDRMDATAPYSSATAFQTGELVISEEPQPTPDDEYFVGLFPYSVASVPLSIDEHRYGVLTILRPSSHDGVLNEGQINWLKESSQRLAQKLAQLTQTGVPVVSSFRPVLVPMFEGTPPESSQESQWGLPYARGSSGLTLMYPLRKLAVSLNRALTTKDITIAAKSYILEPFGGCDITLSTVADGRIWIAGHSGAASAAVKRLHGSSVNDHNPTAETLYGRPIFLSSDSQKLTAYPNTPDDGGQSWAYLPLRGGKFRRVGVCCITFSEDRKFAPEEQTVMMMMADLLGSALERVRYSESDHELAESLQKRLLPRFLSELPEVAIAARHLAADPNFGSGGDWYDVITLLGDHIGLVVGDVEGHGVESSVVMGQVRTAILAYASEGHGPVEIIARTNRLLIGLDTDLLVTCCVLYLDVAGGKVEGCLAGHPPPIVRSPHNTAVAVEAAPGLPLGIAPTTAYHAFSLDLTQGSLIFLYTNGLVPDSQVDVITAAEDILSSLGEETDLSLEGFADRIVAALPDSTSRRDDIALLCARYEGSATGLRGPSSRMEIQRRDLRGVKAARKFVAENLKEWGQGELVDNLEIIVSELVTNALIHADSDVDLRLRMRPGRIEMEVRDSNINPPVHSYYANSEEEAQAENGRGLTIVEALSSVCGSSPTGRGKTVWLEVSIEPSLPDW